MNNNTNWLDDGIELGLKLNGIRDFFKEQENNYYMNVGDKCLHDYNHCQQIEFAIHHLIPDHHHSLTLKERYFLLAAPWVLNIPWILNPTLNLSDYELHNEGIKNDANLKMLGIKDPEESAIFREVISFHDHTKDISKCPSIMHDGPDQIRVRLITAYIRLADAIHIDNCKGPKSLFSFFDKSNSPELYHWLKSKLGFNYLSILPTPRNWEVKLNLHDAIKESNITKALMDFFYLHINSVKDTLVMNALANPSQQLPCYLSFTDKIQEPVATTPQKLAEINELIHEFNMYFSPNARMVQILYISTMKKVVETRGATPQILLEEVNKLQSIAKQVQSIRKCHVAFGRNIKDLDNILNKKGKPSEKMHKITDWTNESQNSYEKRYNKLSENVVSALGKGKYDHFLLFGYSSTVIDALKKFTPDRRIKIFVCEAHNKSRFDAVARQSYNDGYKYAQAIIEATDGRCDKFSVRLIPDITISSIFKEYSQESEKWLALFGANGITPDANCGHSAGHLTLATICKKNKIKIPVYIACDSYKVGQLPSRKDIQYTRNDQWLQDIPAMKQNKQIELLNLRESIIESELIDLIITDDGEFSIDNFKFFYSKQV